MRQLEIPKESNVSVTMEKGLIKISEIKMAYSSH